MSLVSHLPPLLATLILLTSVPEQVFTSGFSYEDFAQQFYSSSNANPANDATPKVFYQPNVVSSQQPGQPITIDVPPLVVPVNFNLRSKSPHQQSGNLFNDVIGRLKPDVYFTPDARQILDKGIESKSKQLFNFEVPIPKNNNNNNQKAQTGSGSMYANTNVNNKKDNDAGQYDSGKNQAPELVNDYQPPPTIPSLSSPYASVSNSQPAPTSGSAPGYTSNGNVDQAINGIKLHHFQVRPQAIERDIPMTKEREMLLNYLANYKPIQPGVHHIRSSHEESPAAQPAPQMAPSVTPTSISALTNSNPLLGNKPWYIEPAPNSGSAGMLDSDTGSGNDDKGDNKKDDMPMDMDSYSTPSSSSGSRSYDGGNTGSLLEDDNKHYPLSDSGTSGSAFDSYPDMDDDQRTGARLGSSLRKHSASQYEVSEPMLASPPAATSSPSSSLLSSSPSSSASSSGRLNDDYRSSMAPIDRQTSPSQPPLQTQTSSRRLGVGHQHQNLHQSHHHQPHHHSQNHHHSQHSPHNASPRYDSTARSSSSSSSSSSTGELSYGQRIPKNKLAHEGSAAAESMIHRSRLAMPPLGIRRPVMPSMSQPTTSFRAPEAHFPEPFTPLRRPAAAPYRFREF